MGKRLTEICCRKGISIKELTSEVMEVYRNNRMDEDTLISAMVDIDKIMGGDVIVMGGFCANSKLLGFRKMRRASNDLDCITDEGGINVLYEYFNDNLFVTKNFGDLFLEYKGIPCGFDVEETHNWKIPGDFFSDSIRFYFDGGGLNSISPEFLIALKAKRSILKENFYGKDAVDTANILIAPFCKSKLKKINYDKVGHLMMEYSSSSIDKLNQYVDFIEERGKKNLKKSEYSYFDGCLLNLRNSIKFN